MLKIIQKWLQKLTDWGRGFDIFKTRALYTGQTRELKSQKKQERRVQEKQNPTENFAFHLSWERKNPENSEQTLKTQVCPYCHGKNVFKRGKRKKKYEVVQLYFCKDCQRTFTFQKVKGKHYPLKVILDGLSFYNLGYTLEDSCKLLKEKYGLNVKPSSLANWVDEFSSLCKYSRLRKFGVKLFSAHQVIKGINLYHRQVYKFRIHQAKLSLLLQEDVRHRKFWPLREFLEAIFAECPHYLFKQGLRASEIKARFNLSQVLIREKTNYANRIAGLVLQAVRDNKLRHEVIQQFMLCNDSVTVASEVPVYLLPEDIEHMESQLGFEIPVKIEKVLTGHIDLIQLRNGAVHILDYKPNAAKEKPIEQLTLYALGLSRLTGLRLYDIKCGWFDERNYFEFFPLHVVYKLGVSRKQVSQNQQKLLETREAIS